jgi:GNAT superfamily N-acetyltransferase
MTYRVRRAAQADAEAIARVHIASWKTTYAGLVSDDVMARRTAWSVRYPLWVERLAADKTVFVAEDEAGIFGFAGACAMPERPQDYEPLPQFDAYLESLYLLAGRQQAGCGRALLAAVAGDLIARGHRSLGLHVLSTNPARAFYEHLGAAFVRDEPAYDDLSCQCAYGFADLHTLLAR